MKSILLNKVTEIVLEETSKGNHLTEDVIARQLGISRTPVREILRHLEEEGILERKQRKGIRLRISSLREIIEIYDLRSVLEGLACRLLAQKIEGKTLERLRELSRKYTEAMKKRKLSLMEDRRIEMNFHSLILSECGNKRLQKTWRNLDLLSVSFQLAHEFELEHSDLRPEKYPHESIVEALEKGDPGKAEMAAKLHVQEKKDEILKLFLGHSISPIYTEANDTERPGENSEPVRSMQCSNRFDGTMHR